MSMQRQRKGRRWPFWLLAVALVGAVVYGLLNRSQLAALVGGGTTTQTAAATPPTVEIQSATVAQTAVSASGNLTLADERSVALAVGGVVAKVDVAVGDTVTAGQKLLTLETAELERTLAEARLTVESAKIALAKLQEPATAAEIASAEAALNEAKANLADVKAGPSAEEIAAARSSLAAAQSSYSELQAGPSDAEKTQLSASLKQAEVALQQAQRAYDQIAWQNSSGMTSQAADLQNATISYEAAKAAYEQSTAAASNSDLQSAVSNIQSAQVKLDELLASPTAAEIATAEAQVATAESTLADLQQGATDDDVRSAKITLEQGLLALHEAQRDLAAATLTAPVAGVVTALNAEVGVRSAADTVVAAIADPTQLELEIGVAEADIPRVSMGQAAEVAIDALPGKRFAGVVASIAPVADSTASAVSYPVTVRLTGDDLANVKPGMNAVATLANADTAAADSWLVPTNALRTQNGTATVMVVRNGAVTPVTVTPGTVQGEWTMVTAAALQSGDSVIGSLTSNIDSNGGFGEGPPGGGMMMGGGGPPGN